MDEAMASAVDIGQDDVREMISILVLIIDSSRLFRKTKISFMSYVYCDRMKKMGRMKRKRMKERSLGIGVF